MALVDLKSDLSNFHKPNSVVPSKGPSTDRNGFQVDPVNVESAIDQARSPLAGIRRNFTTDSVIPSEDNVLVNTEKFQVKSLSQIYKKFNLQDASFQTSYIQHPLILRGIQRKENPEPQRWGLSIVDDAGFIRGGAATAKERSVIDTVRIAKWMASPKGKLWVVKQIGLGLSNPNVEENETSTFLGIQQTKIHTGIASLLSVYATAFGIHVTRHGIPFMNEGASYEKVITSRNDVERNSNNRLVKLTSTIISRNESATGRLEIARAWGGPQSLYGIGYTTLNVASDISKRAKSQNDRAGVNLDKPGHNNLIKSYATLAYDKIPESTGSFNDFRASINTDELNRHLIGGNISKDNYTDNNIETKYGFPNLSNVKRSKGEKFLKSSKELSDARKAGKEHRTILIKAEGFAGDKVNAIDFMKEGIAAKDIYPVGAKDFIEFYFSDADTTIDSVKSALVFRATLTGISDSFNPQWTKIDIMGRPDGAWIYSSYDRNISFTFTVAAQSRSEMIPIWRKLNYLASYTMPEYTNGGRPSGPFMRITIGNLFQQTPGFITSLTYTVPDDSPWDIAGDFDSADDYKKDAKQLPMYIEVGVSYTVISDFRPQKYGRAYSLSARGNNQGYGENWLDDSDDDSNQSTNQKK